MNYFSISEAAYSDHISYIRTFLNKGRKIVDTFKVRHSVTFLISELSSNILKEVVSEILSFLTIRHLFMIDFYPISNKRNITLIFE